MSEYDAENSDAAGGDASEQAPDYSQSEEQTDASFVVESTSPGRSAGIALMAILMIGVGTIYMMRLKAGPSIAVAKAETITAQATIKEFLSDGSKNIANMRDLLKNTEKVIQQFVSYPSVTQVKLEDLKTNPFRYSLAKPDTSAADNQRLQKEEQAKLKTETIRQAGMLKLQSILSGTHPTCMINNQMLTEGQDIDGFAVEKISPAGVIVKKNGLRLQLTMKH